MVCGLLPQADNPVTLICLFACAANPFWKVTVKVFVPWPEMMVTLVGGTIHVNPVAPADTAVYTTGSPVPMYGQALVGPDTTGAVNGAFATNVALMLCAA